VALAGAAAIYAYWVASHLLIAAETLARAEDTRRAVDDAK
jgi:hypothetical protein